MDEPAFPPSAAEDARTARRAEGVQPPPDREQTDLRAPAESAYTSPPTPIEITPTIAIKGRRRGILPWVFAAVAVLVGAITIGTFVVNRSSRPESVAQLPPQTDSVATIPMDDEAARRFEIEGVWQDDFVPHGSYGVLQVWSATTEATRCLALVAGEHVSVFHCTPPTTDTIADFNIDSSLVPLSPSGEPDGDIRFILHDGMVHVYLSPERDAGYY